MSRCHTNLGRKILTKIKGRWNGINHLHNTTTYVLIINHLYNNINWLWYRNYCKVFYILHYEQMYIKMCITPEYTAKKSFFRNHLETCCYKLLPSCLLLSSCTVLMERTIHDHKRHIFEWDSRCVCDKWTQLKTFFLISNSYIFTPQKLSRYSCLW